MNFRFGTAKYCVHNQGTFRSLPCGAPVEELNDVVEAADRYCDEQKPRGYGGIDKNCADTQQ